ncbi:UNVERIFIED_CONTAM: hypothetical protein Sangu_3017400 [Sesamum angustifolium]|uniref:Secreted protein n=1 Tax=Sesamum angustifolium TaxID=2727405 RepID=A0AAW2KKU0_9LAMI
MVFGSSCCNFSFLVVFIAFFWKWVGGLGLFDGQVCCLAAGGTVLLSGLEQLGSAAWLEVVEFGAATWTGLLGSDWGWACWAGRTRTGLGVVLNWAGLPRSWSSCGPGVLGWSWPIFV